MSISAGLFFYAKNTQRFLFLLRTDKNANNWGIPGGKIEDNETLFEGINRECMEEIGFSINSTKIIPIQKFVNNSFTYHTFFCSIDNLLYFRIHLQ